MKIGPRELDSFLKQPKKAQGVLFYGPDAGLVRERSVALAQLILGKNSDPLNRIELTGEQLKADPARLRDELNAFSLMGGERLVVVRDAGEKLGPLIAEAFDGPPPTAYLIVESDELSPSTSLRQAFEKAANLAAVACYRDEGRNLDELIRSTLSGLGLRASSDALQYLAANLGNDRGVTLSELQKIALYMGPEKEVTLDIAMELTGQNASESIDDVCHAVACGRVQEAHSLLARLLHEGVQPVSIVRSLLRHFQRLDIAAAHTRAGVSPDDAIKALRPPVFFKYVPPTRRALSLWKARQLAQVESLLLRAEKDLKSSTLSPALLLDRIVQQTVQLVA